MCVWRQNHGIGGKWQKLVDDIPTLRRMCDEGKIVACPPQDYDDSYTIRYAQQKSGAIIVSNDM